MYVADDFRLTLYTDGWYHIEHKDPFDGWCDIYTLSTNKKEAIKRYNDFVADKITPPPQRQRVIGTGIIS